MTDGTDEGVITDIRKAVAELCSRYPNEYWRRIDAQKAYPEEFVSALSDAGWLGILIPEEYGGGGQGMAEASAVLEEINYSGGNGAACHAQMYTMGALVRHGSTEQKETYLPAIARGDLRMQAFGITEPDAGSNTSRIRTFARRTDGGWMINGHKIFTSRVQHSDLMLLLTRTTPIEEAARPTDGLSLFLVDLRHAGATVTAQKIDTSINHETNELFIDNLFVPESNLIGIEGQGLRHVFDGMNAERILLSAECIGDGRWFCQRAAEYASHREVFDQPIGAHQGVQFPIARAYAAVTAAAMVQADAARKFDSGLPCSAEANMAKLLCSEASWQAADAAMDCFGGYAFATEYDVERKFRETRLYKNAPINNNLVLAFIGHNVLKMPKSY
ncbi:acyl-CoA dehydrogenase family protein [Nocardioides sp. KR10-350]|uniref:acyl-CoA dehydrogenase family protein n=1 Tax=Nocardioides cheoyonin TaxID=3156615 RepID=UPI0032B5B751